MRNHDRRSRMTIRGATARRWNHATGRSQPTASVVPSRRSDWNAALELSVHTGNLFSGSNSGKAGRSTSGNSDDRPLEGGDRSASGVILTKDTATEPNHGYPKIPFLAIDRLLIRPERRFESDPASHSLPFIACS